MRNLRSIPTIACTLLLLVSSCGKQRGAHSVEELAAQIVIELPDTSLIGRLEAIHSDSLTFVDDFTQESTACAYTEALNNGLLGQLKEGERYAITIDGATKMATHILNITQLSGNWFFDKDEESGVNFTAAGALGSINPTGDYSFRKWKPYNGRLILYYIHKEDVVKDSRDYLSDTTEIEQFTEDRLVFRFRGQRLSCHRQKEAVKVHFHF